MNDRDCENCIHKVNGACNVWECKFEPKRGITREEAKALLLNISAYDIDTQRGMKKQEAIEMAIKALEQEPCDKCVYSTSEGCQYDDITETIPPFDDCISRQAVLDLLENTNNGWIINKVLQLPPVNPQKAICPSAGVDCEDCPAHGPKTGYWVKSIWSKDVWECSECGWEIYDQEAKTNYCPSCGCRMVEPQESEG
jgi:hypothetical protein